VKDFDYKSRLADIQYVSDQLPRPKDHEKCLVNELGKGHVSLEECPNTARDSFDKEEYCVPQRSREYKQQRETLEWLPAMIDFFWQNGIQSDQIDFLEKGNFMRQYE
jgi:hypothetical protein